MAYTNKDGLTIMMGGEQGVTNNKGNTINSDDSQLVAHVDLTELPLTPLSLDSFVPAGSYITGAYVIPTEDALGGTSITVGTYKKGGGAIVAAGILLAATGVLADLKVGNALEGDGTQVAGTITVGADDAYLGVTAGGTFTAGKVRIVVYFVPGAEIEPAA